MKEKYKSEVKGLEISLGMLTGYLMVGTIYKFAKDLSWSEAFSSKEIIFAVAGIALSLVIILRLRRKGAHNEE